MKKHYQPIELLVLRFDEHDVIATSVQIPIPPDAGGNDGAWDM